MGKVISAISDGLLIGRGARAILGVCLVCLLVILYVWAGAWLLATLPGRCA